MRTCSLFQRVQPLGISPAVGGRSAELDMRSATKLTAASVLMVSSICSQAARAAGVSLVGGTPSSRSRQGSSASV